MPLHVLATTLSLHSFGSERREGGGISGSLVYIWRNKEISVREHLGGYTEKGLCIREIIERRIGVHLGGSR